MQIEIVSVNVRICLCSSCKIGLHSLRFFCVSISKTRHWLSYYDSHIFRLSSIIYHFFSAWGTCNGSIQCIIPELYWTFCLTLFWFPLKHLTFSYDLLLGTYDHSIVINIFINSSNVKSWYFLNAFSIKISLFRNKNIFCYIIKIFYQIFIAYNLIDSKQFPPYRLLFCFETF